MILKAKLFGILQNYQSNFYRLTYTVFISLTGESVVTEWDLVCGDSWIPEFSTSMINIGQAVGGLMIQPLGDRFGRKKMIGEFSWKPNM